MLIVLYILNRRRLQLENIRNRSAIYYNAHNQRERENTLDSTTNRKMETLKPSEMTGFLNRLSGTHKKAVQSDTTISLILDNGSSDEGVVRRITRRNKENMSSSAQKNM